MNTSHSITKVRYILLLALMLFWSYADDSTNAAFTKDFHHSRTQSEIIPDTYIAICDSSSLPSSFISCIESLQGKITSNLDEAGMAIVSSTNPDFAKEAAKIEGVLAVIPDRKRQWIDPDWSNQVIRLP